MATYSVFTSCGRSKPKTGIPMCAELDSILKLFDAGGWGVQDIAKALMFYLKAADLGFAIGQTNLGRFYQEGIGCDRDLTAAAQW
jgi:TPR repeat protein